DEDVVDAGIELVEHPGGVGAAEEGEGALDEVVEVEEAALALGARIGGEDRRGEADERAASAKRLRGLSFFGERDEPRLFGLQAREEAGKARRQRLGDDAPVASAARLALFGKEYREIGR